MLSHVVWKTNECHKYIDYGLQINKICGNIYINFVTLFADKYIQASHSSIEKECCSRLIYFVWISKHYLDEFLYLNSEPQFSFERSEYVVDESEQQLEVGIRRTGTDLSKPSSVTIRSRMTNPKSAQGQQLSLNCIEE